MGPDCLSPVKHDFIIQPAFHISGFCIQDICTGMLVAARTIMDSVKGQFFSSGDQTSGPTTGPMTAAKLVFKMWRCSSFAARERGNELRFERGSIFDVWDLHRI